VTPHGVPSTPEPIWVGDVRIRTLAAAESARLGDAIRSVYGDTYPVLWAYDTDEVARRISAGLLMSAIAETADSELLCHSALSLAAVDDVVGHAGQAVTLPAAQGQRIFTRVKRYLVEWATSRGLMGMYSKATAAHPYSQRALLDLGGHETGFLLGFIPESVENSLSAPATRPAVCRSVLSPPSVGRRTDGVCTQSPPGDRAGDDRDLRLPCASR
jgi:hypothetical protein